MENLYKKIDELTALDVLVKEQSTVLKRGKEELAYWYAEHREQNKVETPAGNTATFSVSEVFDPLSPLAVYEALQAKDMGGRLFDVVKVDMAALRQVLSPEEVAALRGKPTGEKISVRLKGGK